MSTTLENECDLAGKLGYEFAQVSYDVSYKLVDLIESIGTERAGEILLEVLTQRREFWAGVEKAETEFTGPYCSCGSGPKNRCTRCGG